MSFDRLNKNSRLNYIKDLWEREDNFKGFNNSLYGQKTNRLLFSKKRYFQVSVKSICGILDFFLFLIMLFYISLTKSEKVKLLFIAKNFCVDINGRLEIRIAPYLFEKNTIFINSSKEHYLGNLGGKKVYNIGFFVKFISFFLRGKNNVVEKQFMAYQYVNDILLKFNGVFESVNFFWFYDLNSLSLIFSKYRDYHKLVEIQHGSIINYPPYEFPAPVKIADIFYVRNESTALYLQNHLCKHFDCEYKLIPYPSITQRKIGGLNILYASTIEFEGFHPVFKDFLKSMSNNLSEINLTIRLHPRERGQENLFLTDLKEFKGAYGFDNSENWLLSNAIEGLIVISPWSSTLEEAYDNGFKAITIDLVGKERFQHLIDGISFLYSSDLKKTLLNWKVDEK